MKQLAIVQEQMARGELTLDEGIKKIMELSGQAGIVEDNSEDDDYEEDLEDEDDDMEDNEEQMPSHKRVKEGKTIHVN